MQRGREDKFYEKKLMDNSRGILTDVPNALVEKYRHMCAYTIECCSIFFFKRDYKRLWNRTRELPERGKWPKTRVLGSTCGESRVRISCEAKHGGSEGAKTEKDAIVHTHTGPSDT